MIENKKSFKDKNMDIKTKTMLEKIKQDDIEYITNQKITKHLNKMIKVKKSELKDRQIDISEGDSISSNQVTANQVMCSEFQERLKHTLITKEVSADYSLWKSKDASKKQKEALQAAKSAAGYFIPGAFKDGIRNDRNLMYRCAVVLDCDSVSKEEFTQSIKNLKAMGCRASYYTTHSHLYDGKSYCFRIVVFLDKNCSKEQFVALSKAVAECIYPDIRIFDKASWICSQPMFFATSSKNSTFFRAEAFDGYLIDTQETLNAIYLPQTELKEQTLPINSQEMETKEDPTQKAGYIGAFNKVYSPLSKAIEHFLPNVYEMVSQNRYHLIGAASTGGLVIYDDGKFAYSHHTTDSLADGHLHDAFDIVKDHLFSSLNSQEQMASMIALCKQDVAVNAVYIAKQMTSNATQTQIPAVDSWLTTLSCNKKGDYNSNVANIKIILENDPGLKGHVKKNLFSGMKMEVVKPLPWRNDKDTDKSFTDADLHALYNYFEINYSITNTIKIKNAFMEDVQKNAFHPIMDYFTSLESWDRVERIYTLLPKYFGTEDNPYLKECVELFMKALVRRIFNPGIKYDYLFILIGPQGIGKSTFFERLVNITKEDGEFYTCFTYNKNDIEKNFENILTAWLLEWSELAGIDGSNEDILKTFIGNNKDTFRAKYAADATTHKRKCNLCATTNNHNFLTDPTGNRRFWCIDVPGVKDGANKMRKDFTNDFINDLWAEAYYKAKEDEKADKGLFLSPEAEEYFAQRATEHQQMSVYEKDVNEYLEDNPLKNFFTTTEIIREKLTWVKGTSNKKLQKEVSMIMKTKSEFKKVQRGGHWGFLRINPND